MNDKEAITKLKKIFFDQIKWYKHYMDIEDEDYVYDCVFDTINDLNRGDFMDILKILVSI